MIIPVTIQACLQSTVKFMVAQDTNHHTHRQYAAAGPAAAELADLAELAEPGGAGRT